MKSTVLIDTNIILDFLLHRSSFYEDANHIMTLCERSKLMDMLHFTRYQICITF